MFCFVVSSRCCSVQRSRICCRFGVMLSSSVVVCYWVVVVDVVVVAVVVSVCCCALSRDFSPEKLSIEPP